MRVFVAGAGGAVGRRLIPALKAAGWDVTGMTRSAAKAELVRELGAEPVIHELTALPDAADFRHLDRMFALTNRLRTDGLDLLIEAARAAGAKRFLAQSFAGWPFARTGGPVKTEADPLDPNPDPAFRATLGAIRYLERRVVSLEDMTRVVLRYGALYGPGTSFAPGGSVHEAVKRRRLPIVGSGAGVWSFLHVDDAAGATVAAAARGRGIYNVVDDAPAPVREWLPHLARTLGAKPPRRVPVFFARWFIGPGGVAMMTDIRGAANDRAKAELGWSLVHPTSREGFRTLVAPAPVNDRRAEDPPGQRGMSFAGGFERDGAPGLLHTGALAGHLRRRRDRAPAPAKQSDARPAVGFESPDAARPGSPAHGRT